MSDIIVEFVADLLDMAEDQGARENIITFGIAAWNLAIMSAHEGKDVMSFMKDFPPLKEAAKDPELAQALTSLLLMLVERKHNEYAHINRYIGDFKVTQMKKDDFQLNIVSVLVPTSKKPKKPLLSGLLNKAI